MTTIGFFETLCSLCERCREYKRNKKIIKNDKTQNTAISFSIPSVVATISDGVQCAPKCSATTALYGLEAHQEIQNRLEANIGDGVNTRIKSETHFTAIRFHGSTQQPSSETEFGNWVWAFGMPIQLCGWPQCVFCILLPLIIKLLPYYHLNCSHF